MDFVRYIIAISGLAVRVYLAYKDAPWGDFGYILEDIAAHQVLIDKVAQYFKGTRISSDDHHRGQKVLKGCQGVLEDLKHFIDKYQRLASINRSLVINRVKLGKYDITVLHVRLISNSGLLTGFYRRCVFRDTVVYIHFINPMDINISIQLSMHGSPSTIGRSSRSSNSSKINHITDRQYKR